MILCDGRMRSLFRGVSLWKMATVKSLEDMLSSEVDESAVTALVGSLESQLSSSTSHPPSQDANTSPATVNHVNCNPVVDGAVIRLVDGQKHGPNSGASQPVVLPNAVKTVPNASQDSESTCASTTAANVLVTLPGALPASGYITQVTGQGQQTFFAPVVSNSSLSAAKTVSASNQDIKIVYTTQPQVAVTNSTGLCNNVKAAVISNGASSTAPVSLITIRPTQPTVNACINSTVVSTSSMSAIHDFANIASQQAPIAITNTCHVSVCTTQTSPVVLNSKTNGRPVARVQLRDRIDKIADKTSVNKSNLTVITTRPQDVMPVISCGAVTTQGSVVVTAPPKTQQQLAHHVNVVSQVVTNPSLLPAGVQIINVNPRLGAPTLAGAKALAPRVLLSNPLRIATSPQIITTRPGVVGQMHVASRNPAPPHKFMTVPAGKNTITLQPGMVRGAIIVKTENGPLQVVNIGGASGTALPAGATYRLQSIQPNAQSVRAVTPQQMTVTVPVSAATAIKANQASSASTAQTVMGTVLQHGPSSANTVRLRGPSVITRTPPQAVAVKVGVNGNITTPLTVQTTAANNTPSTPSQMSPNTAKKKCKNFLSTLIRLADEQPASVAKSVRNLIQGIIDGTIQAEEFTAKLQKELNSAPQPYLVPFLKKNLPFLRHSLITKELTIEGVRPPPPGALSLPHPALGNLQQQVQTNQKRPTQPGAQVRLLSTTAPTNLTAQLLQSNQTIGGQRFPSPRLPTTPMIGQNKNFITTTQMNKVSTFSSAAASSPATVGALQAKSPLLKGSSLIALKDKGKNTFSVLRDDDDINDVAAMGGVNLIEESQKILASTSELVGTQIRSCKDESFLVSSALQRRLHTIAMKHGLEDVSPDVTALVAHAAEERLKTLLERLAVIAEHRIENPKCDSRYEVTQDVRSQIKFLEELDRLERRRHEEQEREILLRAAKSRSKLEDPEQLKLKQKAKEMQRAELEELRQREANMTALLAIGPRKKMKLDSDASPGTSQFCASSNMLGASGTTTKVMPRPRIKRVTYRDLLYLMEQDRETIRTPLLYKSYLNLK